MSLMGRGMEGRPRTASLPVVACPTKDCDGTLYQLKEGEHLSRLPRAGWHGEKRQTQCEICNHRQIVPVLVRGAS